jgi:hypothetical protein
MTNRTTGWLTIFLDSLGSGMKMLGWIFALTLVGIPISMIGPAVARAPVARHVTGAPASVGNAGRWGVSGRLQPNGAATGSVKLNSGISGSQIRPKH